MGSSFSVVFAMFFLVHVLFWCLKCCHLQWLPNVSLFYYENYIGFCCMKLFQRLLRGVSSGHGFVRFLCFFNQMFSENEFFKNAANPLTDQNLSMDSYMISTYLF